MSSSGSSPVSWFSQLVSFIEAKAQAAEAEVVKVAEEIGPVVVQYTEEFLSSLAEIAVGAVLKQAPLAISGAEKFGSAVADVVQSVEAQGKSLAIQDAQAATQAAYQSIKNVVTGATTQAGT